MIASLTGTLFAKHPDHVIIDVGGVGYEVMISARTYDRLPASGDEVFLYVYTSVREDGLGFAFSPAPDRYVRVCCVESTFHLAPEWSENLPHPV